MLIRILSVIVIPSVIVSGLGIIVMFFVHFVITVNNSNIFFNLFKNYNNKTELKSIHIGNCYARDRIHTDITTCNTEAQQ